MLNKSNNHPENRQLFAVSFMKPDGSLKSFLKYLEPAATLKSNTLRHTNRWNPCCVSI